MNIPKSEVFNKDCMIDMVNFPDNHFDLAIVDPPYGINIEKQWGNEKFGYSQNFSKNYFDSIPPDKNYFIELQRISKKWIIFGANHFIENIPNSNNSAWIVWDKGQRNFTLSDGELALTNFNCKLRIFNYSRSKSTKCSNSITKKFHITQKPIALYDWIIKHYGKDCKSILDTHLGSGSSRISAYKNKIDFTAYELDNEYYLKQEERFKKFLDQQSLF